MSTSEVLDDVAAPHGERDAAESTLASDTVGTGSVVGVGCTLVTVGLIVLGILVFVALRLF